MAERPFQGGGQVVGPDVPAGRLFDFLRELNLTPCRFL